MLTAEKLNRVINEAGLNKAGRNDKINYELIKNLGSKARAFIMEFFNKIWVKGAELQRNWRIESIITLIKEGKERLKKIIADRLHFRKQGPHYKKARQDSNKGGAQLTKS